MPHTRRDVYKRIDALEIDKCPFVNTRKAPDDVGTNREEMKECRWLKPEIVIQIKFTEWTPDGHLRHASFVGLRDDKEPRQIVRE